MTLDEIKDLFKSLKDIKIETETVVDDLVAGIKTLLDIIIITL